MTQPDFPPPVRLRGRLFWNRADLEAHKRALIGAPPPPVDPNARIELVPAAEVAKEFGVGRRTIGRRIARRPVAEVGLQVGAGEAA